MTDFTKNFNTVTNGNDDADRYDPVMLMFKERVIMVEGEVNTNLAHHIISQLKKLEYMDSTKPITMVINSPGGSVIDGLAIYDVMRHVSCPITTVGNGMQASMGSILLAGGDERTMMPNAMLLIHQIMGGASGGTQHTSFEISASFMSQLHEKLKSVYVEFTGLNHAFWDIVGERDSWLNAEQAEKIGFIHSVTSVAKRGPYASEATRAKPPGLAGALQEATRKHIAKMSAQEIAQVINSGNAEGGVYARLRGDLITRLAEFPEYWTEAKKREHEAANQNNKRARAVASKNQP